MSDIFRSARRKERNGVCGDDRQDSQSVHERHAIDKGNCRGIAQHCWRLYCHAQL